MDSGVAAWSFGWSFERRIDHLVYGWLFVPTSGGMVPVAVWTQEAILTQGWSFWRRRGHSDQGAI